MACGSSIIEVCKIAGEAISISQMTARSSIKEKRTGVTCCVIEMWLLFREYGVLCSKHKEYETLQVIGRVLAFFEMLLCL